MQTQTKGKEVSKLLPWLVVVAMVIWLLRLTVMMGDQQKRQESFNTQILNIVVLMGNHVGLPIRVTQTLNE